MKLKPFRSKVFYKRISWRRGLPQFLLNCITYEMSRITNTCERESDMLCAILHIYDFRQLALRSSGDKRWTLKMHVQLSCDVCPKTFSNRSNLSRHKQIHSGVKKYSCLECKKSFVQNVDLKNHSLIHTGEKPHKCPQCNFSCNQSSDLKRHIRKHTGEKLYNCNQCDFSCNTSSSLKKHIKRHTGEKLYNCNHSEYPAITVQK